MRKIFRIVFLVLGIGISAAVFDNHLKASYAESRLIQIKEPEEAEVKETDFPERAEKGPKLVPVRTSSVPLFIQTDEEWNDLPYGTDGDKNMGENGCALATLAMVGNHYGFGSTPKTILEWAGEDYYVDGAGSSWDIFSDYAAEHNLNFLDLGSSMQAAVAELEAGHLVVVSVKKSRFTEVGHIMLLTGYQNGKFSLNDPNDDEKKMNNYNWFDEAVIEDASVNFWSFSN